jgi:hypothetical protein
MRIYKTYFPEITADEAKTENAAIPNFDNSTGRIFEHSVVPVKSKQFIKVDIMPLIGDVYWTEPNTVCTLTPQ